MEFLVQDDIREVTWEIINRFLIPEYERKRKASGKWQSMLDVRVDGLKAVIMGADYTEFLVEGRPPNKNQDPQAIANWARWYGQNVFAQWVQAKGISASPYAVAYKVAREGYDGDPELVNVLDKPEVLDFIYNFLGEKMTGRVVEIFKNDLKNLKNDN